MSADADETRVSIKNVGPFDIGRLARLHKACFDEPWSRADLAHLLALPGGFGLIGRVYERTFGNFEGMRGVGFALCRVVRDEAELLSIGVVPAYRRRNIGATLLQAAMDRCARGGARVIFLEAAIDNHPAQGLYREQGFTRVGRRDNYYQRGDGTRVAAHTMRCELQPPVEPCVPSMPGYASIFLRAGRGLR